MTTEEKGMAMAEQAMSIFRNQGQQALWRFLRDNTAPNPNTADSPMGIAIFTDGSAVTLDITELTFLNPAPPGSDHEAHQQKSLVEKIPLSTPNGFIPPYPVSPESFTTHSIFKEILNLYLVGAGLEPTYDNCLPFQAAAQMQAPSLEAALYEAARTFEYPDMVFALMEKLLRDTAQAVLESLPIQERETLLRVITARYNAEYERMARSMQHLREGTHDPEWQAQLDRALSELPRMYRGIPHEDEEGPEEPEEPEEPDQPSQ